MELKIQDLLRSPARHAGWVILAISSAGLALAYPKLPVATPDPSVPQPPADPYTDISEFSGTARLANGVARNNDFLALIPFIQLQGAGDINYIDSVLDYELQAQVTGAKKFSDGYSMEEVTKELSSESKFNDSRIRIMEDQKKKSRGHLGSRQSYFNHVLAKRPRLAEVRATLDLLRGAADWQRWFADVPERGSGTKYWGNRSQSASTGQFQQFTPVQYVIPVQ